MMRRIVIALAMLPITAISAPINDFSFKSPAFNGSGYSSHVLTIENQEQTRRTTLQKDIQAAFQQKLEQFHLKKQFLYETMDPMREEMNIWEEDIIRLKKKIQSLNTNISSLENPGSIASEVPSKIDHVNVLSKSIGGSIQVQSDAPVVDTPFEV